MQTETRMLSPRTAAWDAAPPGKSFLPDRIGCELETLERKQERVRRLQAGQAVDQLEVVLVRCLDRNSRYDYHLEADALRLLYLEGLSVPDAACRLFGITPTSPRYEQACRAVRHKRDHAFSLLAAANPPELRTSFDRESAESELWK